VVVAWDRERECGDEKYLDLVHSSVEQRAYTHTSTALSFAYIVFLQTVFFTAQSVEKKEEQI
jgi:hypothetical protein